MAIADAHFLGGAVKHKYEYWCNFSSWTVKEGVLLSLGISPDSSYVSSYWNEALHTFKQQSHESNEDRMLRYECARRMAIAMRARDDGTLKFPIKPYAFLEWLLSVGCPSPQELVEALPNPINPAPAKPIYSTPYLELMNQAIQVYKITPENQEKMEILVEWFQSQKIAGEYVSNNEAKKLASFIRLPASKKGGNKPAKIAKG